jgi:hypothetical protein
MSHDIQVFSQVVTDFWGLAVKSKVNGIPRITTNVLGHELIVIEESIRICLQLGNDQNGKVEFVWEIIKESLIV